MQVSLYFLWCPENGKNYGKKALFDIFTFEIIIRPHWLKLNLDNQCLTYENNIYNWSLKR